MKIGILETGTSPQALAAQYGSYADLFVRMLGAADPGLRFERYQVVDGVFPPAPDLCDGWIITGSRHGVYEDLPWMRRLSDLILELVAQRRPLLGICFGHQIIASALGGRVEKSARGWGLGVHQYQQVGPCKGLGGRGDTLVLNALHQDQVVEKPVTAEVFASSDFCPYAALRYGDSVISFQAHPEFTLDYTAALLEAVKGERLPQAQADVALSGLRAADALNDSGRVARWLVEFFRRQGLMPADCTGSGANATACAPRISGINPRVNT
ncbi:hypothetical protein A8C75_20540 [Marinobacterium aestuarii]|uniref:Glutamine amidotransferase domain-containing protein n=1 Tax=Marinobacterium aestuarii TaxID=1821621 RepID=A0A1A9F353_9GAMM|nr:gamma-glutamyl-gamma-aminobutyrate hydrolase family protein [Marinobacterium aestuarii]ANG64627.1 hypothetical protein A8C75_20540 [Marinobacterium aestuarii]